MTCIQINQIFTQLEFLYAFYKVHYRIITRTLDKSYKWATTGWKWLARGQLRENWTAESFDHRGNLRRYLSDKNSKGSDRSHQWNQCCGVNTFRYHISEWRRQYYNNLWSVLARVTGYETVYVSISILRDALGEAKEILSAEVWRNQKGSRSLLIKTQCWPGLMEAFPFGRDFSNAEKVLFSIQNEMVSRKWKFHLQINCSKILLERIKIFCCAKLGWNSAVQPYVPSTIWDTHDAIWKVHKLWGTWHGLSDCSTLGVPVFTAEFRKLLPALPQQWVWSHRISSLEEDLCDCQTSHCRARSWSPQGFQAPSCRGRRLKLWDLLLPSSSQ